MKKLLLFLFVLLFPLASAVTLSMSPQQIDFIGNVNEEICNEVTLKTDGGGVLIGEDRWAEEGYSERKLKQHNLESSELKLYLDYPKSIEINNNEIIEVCLTGKKKGNYHGALLYRVEGKPVRVGIWMNVSLDSSASKITGKIISKIDEEENFSFLVILPVILTIILIILLTKLNKKGKVTLKKTNKNRTY